MAAPLELMELFEKSLIGTTQRCCLKQFLEVALYKTAVVRPPTSHCTNHQGKTSKICWALLEKDKLISDILLWIPKHGYTSVGQPAKIYIHEICADTGCCLEDLPRVMVDRDR